MRKGQELVTVLLLPASPLFTYSLDADLFGLSKAHAVFPFYQEVLCHTRGKTQGTVMSDSPPL